MFGLFKKKTKPEEPKIGEEWEIIEEDPFPPKRKPIKIIDVKEGWVRYCINSTFNDERMKMSMFLKIFRKCKN